jgi:hypothetical protein
MQSGGEPGARLLKAVGTTVSPDPLLRLARTSPTGDSSVPEILAREDVAFRRGMREGTLLSHRERHQVGDLLVVRRDSILSIESLLTGYYERFSARFLCDSHTF